MTAWVLGGTVGRPPGPGLARQGDRLLDYWTRVRLAPELAACLASRDAPWPRELVRALAVARARTAEAARTRAGTLRRIGAALEAAGVRAMLYKGEAHVRLTHGDPSRRPMSDVDVVVGQGQRAAARAALVDAGLAATPHDTALHDVLVDVGASGPGHPHGVAVEVHDDVFPPPHPFRTGLADVLDRARPADVRGLLVPEVADALLLHAFHAVLFEQEGTKGLLALRDVALLAGALDEVSQRQLGERARALELSGVLEAVVARSIAWAGAPARLAVAPGPAAAGSLRRRAVTWLAVRELDATLRAEHPGGRSLSRRFSAAGWQPGRAATAAALVRGLLGGGAASSPLRLARRLARHAAGAKRALFGSRSGRTP